MREGARRPLADDEMRFDARAVEHLEQADAEDGSGGAGDADDEACGLGLFHAETFSTKPEGSTREVKIRGECRKNLSERSTSELLCDFHGVEIERDGL